MRFLSNIKIVIGLYSSEGCKFNVNFFLKKKNYINLYFKRIIDYTNQILFD